MKYWQSSNPSPERKILNDLFEVFHLGEGNNESHILDYARMFMQSVRQLIPRKDRTAAFEELQDVHECVRLVTGAQSEAHLARDWEAYLEAFSWWEFKRKRLARQSMRAHERAALREISEVGRE